MRAGLFVFTLIFCACSMKARERAEFAAALLLVQKEVPVLARGLKTSQVALTMEEHDSIMRLAKNDRIASLVYLNGAGEARWYRDPHPDHGICLWAPSTIKFETDALDRAARTKAPAYARTSIGAVEVAVPIVLKNKIQGVVIVQYYSGSLG